MFFKEGITDLGKVSERNNSSDSKEDQNDKGEQALTEISVVEVQNSSP